MVWLIVGWFVVGTIVIGCLARMEDWGEQDDVSGGTILVGVLFWPLALIIGVVEWFMMSKNKARGK